MSGYSMSRSLGSRSIGAALLALLLVACGGEGAPPAEETATATATVAGSVSAVDAGGVTVTIEGRAERIVSHSPGATEILFAIGAGPQVVAVDDFSNYPPETEALPKVTYADPSAEQVLSHEPDLVILAENQGGSVEQFRDLGLPVFFLREPRDLDGVLEHIEVLGTLTGHEAEAATLVADLRTRLDAVAAAIQDVPHGPRVFYELDDTLYTVGPDTFIGAALSLVGAENIAAGAPSPFPQLTAEAVVEGDPEVILLADAAFGVTPEAVAARPGWSDTSAVRDGRIYPVDPDVMSRPGPRIVDGIEMLAALLYPDRFE
ncbi:MAG: cobalamin-binding protein [Dehalococcoidia bacterium]